MGISGELEGLLPFQCRGSNLILIVEKDPKNLLLKIQILNHVAFAIGTCLCVRLFEWLVLPTQNWVNDCWVLCASCCSFVVSRQTKTPGV